MPVKVGASNASSIRSSRVPRPAASGIAPLVPKDSDTDVSQDERIVPLPGVKRGVSSTTTPRAEEKIDPLAIEQKIIEKTGEMPKDSDTDVSQDERIVPQPDVERGVSSTAPRDDKKVILLAIEQLIIEKTGEEIFKPTGTISLAGSDAENQEN
jgi:hypothetical protein